MYEIYKAAATRFGLSMNPADPSLFTRTFELKGFIGGSPIQLVRVVGAGGYFIIGTRFPTPLRAGLVLSTAGLLDSLAAIVGITDLEIGDAPFDAAFAIKARDPERARAVLVPAAREALRALPGNIELTDESLSTKFSHREESAALIEETMVRVAAFPAFLPGTGATPTA